MIIGNIPGKAKCPECGGVTLKSKLSFTNFVAWLGKLPVLYFLS